MVVYTLEQRWEILRHYFENHDNIAECVGKLCTDLGREEALLASYILYPAFSSINHSLRSQKQCVDPRISIPGCSQQLNISETPSRRILHKDLGMTPYKVPLGQQLKPIEHPIRFRFAKWA